MGTFDSMFDDREVFDEVKTSGVINADLFARLYSVPEKQRQFVEFPLAAAFECSIPRPIPAGDVEDTDV